MRNANRSLGLMAGVLTLALVLGGCGSSSSRSVIVPTGTMVPVTLDQALSSATNHTGDEFDATVSAPITLEGATVIPQGSRVRGVIVDAKSSGRLHNPGRLELTLTSIEVDGTRYDIDTSDARRSGQSHTKRNVIFIGGGAGAGAIIGGIIGGGKGAAIGGAVGAGGGTAAAAATGKREVYLPAETRLSFPLFHPVTIKVKG